MTDRNTPARHLIVALAYEGLWPLEFGIAAEIFGWPRPELEDRWQAAADEVYPLIRDTLIPADVFDELQKLLAEYRSKPAGP